MFIVSRASGNWRRWGSTICFHRMRWSLVEWGDKFKSIKKRATGEIVIAPEGGDARKITVTLKE